MTDDLDPPRKPVPGELTFTSPRRRKPPRHLADLTAVQRREAVTEHGLPAFRADQVSRHYFTRFADDPASWSDVPAALRDDLAAAGIAREIDFVVFSHHRTGVLLIRFDLLFLEFLEFFVGQVDVLRVNRA